MMFQENKNSSLQCQIANALLSRLFLHCCIRKPHAINPSLLAPRPPESSVKTRSSTAAGMSCCFTKWLPQATAQPSVRRSTVWNPRPAQPWVSCVFNSQNNEVQIWLYYASPRTQTYKLNRCAWSSTFQVGLPTSSHLPATMPFVLIVDPVKLLMCHGHVKSTTGCKRYPDVLTLPDISSQQANHPTNHACGVRS